MFKERDIDVDTFIIGLIIAIIVFAIIISKVTDTMPVEASTGETCLGGMSYYMEKYVAAGGNLEDCIKDTYDVTDAERQILYRIVEAEVTGEGGEDYLQAKKNVASCIFARLESGWANSIEGVVFQNKQFSPISDGRYYTVKVTDQTIKAVNYIIKYGKQHTAEYFCTRTCESYKTGYHSKLTKAFDDAVHAYFYER